MFTDHVCVRVVTNFTQLHVSSQVQDVIEANLLYSANVAHHMLIPLLVYCYWGETIRSWRKCVSDAFN